MSILLFIYLLLNINIKIINKYELRQWNLVFANLKRKKTTTILLLIENKSNLAN